jgi:hypothetical protein
VIFASGAVMEPIAPEAEPLTTMRMALARSERLISRNCPG